jgi:hypothetical protein
MSINILYDLVIEYGYFIRKNNKDGLESWNEIKKIIPPIPIIWTDKSKLFYEQLSSIGVNTSESSEEAKMSKPEWERHHYLLQHGRIIHKNPEGNLVRLLQIAYNTGQFKYELEKEIYPKEQLQYYIINELNKISTFLQSEIEFPRELIEGITGLLSKKGGSKKNKSIDYYLNNYIDNYVI